jgi:hypothetical protein
MWECFLFLFLDTRAQGFEFKVEEPIPDTLRFRATKESELDMKKIW